MCEVKGGCTCGNETCCMDDDFDLTIPPVKQSIGLTVYPDGKRAYSVDVGDLATSDAIAFLNDVSEKFKKGL